MRILFLYPLTFLFSIRVSYSQIVNIESSRMQSDTTGWKGNAGSSFSFTKNEEEITQITLNAHLQYKTKKSLWLILADYGFLKAGSEKFIANSFGHLRYNYKINSWLRWEAFAQAQKNYVTQIDARYLAGAGPRFKLFDSKQFRLYATTLFMYEHEKERTIPVVKHHDVRNSSYISFTLLPANNIEIISTTFYQPLLKEIKDARILNQSVVKIKTGNHFWISLLWNYLYDSFPAGDAPKTTYNFSMGLNYEF
ncbi:MAG: DUF481 domain-containing protein [Bacteroidota bacterium]